MKMTKTQIKNVKKELERQIEIAKLRKNEQLAKTLENDLKYCENWTLEDAVRIIADNKKYLIMTHSRYNNEPIEIDKKTILNSLNGLQTYTKVQIRTYEGSKTKNRITIATIQGKGTRKEMIELAKQWMNDNKIILQDVAFNVY